MEWNDDKIVQLINNGIKNVNHTTLVHAYRYVTNKDYTGGCTACFRRKAIRAVVNYFELIKTEEDDKESKEA